MKFLKRKYYKFKKIIKKLLTKEVYYIYSHDALPAPLNKEDEFDLLVKSKEGDKQALDKLVEHNLRLVVFIAKKFDTTKATIEDLISIGSMGLIKGVKTFKTDKNIKLATYASRCIENEILMFLRKTQKLNREISLDGKLNTDGEGNELMLIDLLGTSGDEAFTKVIKDEEYNYMYKAVKNLPARERQIISMRFGLFGRKAFTQKEVALLLDISQSYISRLEKRIITKLQHQITTDYEPIAK